MRMKRLSILGFLLGLALATVLITWQGWQRISDVLHTAGLFVFWLPIYFSLPLVCALLSWWYLFPKESRPGLWLSAYCTWINFAVNWLLPVAQVGGEIARVRLLLKRQFSFEGSIASVIGDQTLQIISQALYAFTGVVLLGVVSMERSPSDSSPAINSLIPSGQLIIILIASVLILVVLSVGLYWVQQQGLFELFSKTGRKFTKFSKGFSQNLSKNLPQTLPQNASQPLSKGLSDRAITIDEAVLAMYHRRDRLLLAILWRFAFRILAAGETWLALRFLGQPVGLKEAIIIESLSQAIRSAAFILPGGLGAQEGGMMLLSTALGIPSQIGLSVSLCKRIRELVIGVPGLIALQIEESRRVFT